VRNDRPRPGRVGTIDPAHRRAVGRQAPQTRRVLLPTPATRRAVEVRRGEVAGELRGRAVAVTHAPVPGFRSRAAAVAPAVVHPWRWLYRPHAGPISSYSAWRKGVRSR
jgi:hypothetical protein